MNAAPVRCRWADKDMLLRDYHDTEWGVPVRDSRALWEKLILDGFQAGLSWRTILHKREAFREAFAGFDPRQVARFDDEDVARLLGNAAIIRSRTKIEATIRNARAYLTLQDAGEDFADFIWAQVGHEPQPGDGTGTSTRSPTGNAISAALHQRGFSFVGPVIVHAWLQATGVINDHESGCFRRQL